MEKNQDKLQEQEAPLKNHDKAFVQVGKDGQPHIPETADEKKLDRSGTERTAKPEKE